MEKLFHLKENGTNVKTEVMAGITTFLAMAYILGVNPSVLGDAGMDVSSVFLATALSAAVASVIMGLLANYPVALAAGMGVNALFAYTVCGQMGYSWSAALAGVFISGVIFILISVTGVRKMIINAIPVQMKLAIGAGIGFFIAFVGLKNAGIVVANESTFVAIGNFSDPTVLLALLGILITLLLVIRKVPAAVFVGMVITALIGIVAGAVFHIEGMPSLPDGSFITTNFHMEGAGAFMNGFGELFADPAKSLVMIFSFLFVDFFDTAGTLVAIGSKIGLVNPQTGELKNAERALLADAIGTVFGAAVGTSTVTSFVESSSGVGVGGRHGPDRCDDRRALPAVHPDLTADPERGHQCGHCTGTGRGRRHDGAAAEVDRLGRYDDRCRSLCDHHRHGAGLFHLQWYRVWLHRLYDRHDRRRKDQGYPSDRLGARCDLPDLFLGHLCLGWRLFCGRAFFFAKRRGNHFQEYGFML